MSERPTVDETVGFRNWDLPFEFCVKNADLRLFLKLASASAALINLVWELARAFDPRSCSSQSAVLKCVLFKKGYGGGRGSEQGGSWDRVSSFLIPCRVYRSRSCPEHKVPPLRNS